MTQYSKFQITAVASVLVEEVAELQQKNLTLPALGKRCLENSFDFLIKRHKICVFYKNYPFFKNKDH